jgi:hypothetical protein
VLTKGFTGVALVIFEDDSTLAFRFLSADFSLSQGVNVYLPSYGGSTKRRIISPMTGDISGRVSTILVEDMAANFYDLTYSAPSFTIQLYFYDGRYREFQGVKVEGLMFECKAGEMVQLSLDMTCMSESTESSVGNYDSIISFRTSTQKLVSWDKTGTSGVYSGSIMSFSYNIKNNLVVIKTASGLLPRAINRGIQEVTGNIVLADVIEPPKNIIEQNMIYENVAIFNIDDLYISHRIAAHWSYRTPLTPEIITTTLDWVRVDEMTS